MNDLFTTIGRLYMDLTQMQSMIVSYQEQLKSKDEKIKELETALADATASH